MVIKDEPLEVSAPKPPTPTQVRINELIAVMKDRDRPTRERFGAIDEIDAIRSRQRKKLSHYGIDIDGFEALADSIGADADQFDVADPEGLTSYNAHMERVQREREAANDSSADPMTAPPEAGEPSPATWWSPPADPSNRRLCDSTGDLPKITILEATNIDKKVIATLTNKEGKAEELKQAMRHVAAHPEGKLSVKALLVLAGAAIAIVGFLLCVTLVR